MPVTRAQTNGTEPMIKIKKKIRKKRTPIEIEPELNLHLSDDEDEPEPVVTEPDSVSVPCSELQASEPELVPGIPGLFEPLSPCSVLQASEPELVPLRKFADLKKMIVKGQTQPDWKLKKNVKTTKKLENYMFMKDEMFKQNNKAKCQICANSDHEMRAKYTDMCA